MLSQQIGPDQQAYLKPKNQKPELCSAAFNIFNKYFILYTQGFSYVTNTNF